MSAQGELFDYPEIVYRNQAPDGWWSTPFLTQAECEILAWQFGIPCARVGVAFMLVEVER